MRHTLILLLLNCTIHIFAQKDSLSKYFDDGGRTITKNIIKTDLSEFFKANIAIIWDHRFDDHLALQSGIGLLTNGFLQPAIIPDNKLSEKTPNRELKNGFSIILYPLFYHDGFESIHFGFPLKYHLFPGKAYSYEFNLSFGKQWFVTRHFAIDIEAGLGFNFEGSIDKKSFIFDPSITDTSRDELSGIRMVTPASVKVGYIF